jgi:hypothetical protein
MAIMRTFKHLSDFAQMQPVREPVATGEANRAYHCAMPLGRADEVIE